MRAMVEDHEGWRLKTRRELTRIRVENYVFKQASCRKTSTIFPFKTNTNAGASIACQNISIGVLVRAFAMIPQLNQNKALYLHVYALDV